MKTPRFLKASSSKPKHQVFLHRVGRGDVELSHVIEVLASIEVPVSVDFNSALSLAKGHLKEHVQINHGEQINFVIDCKIANENYFFSAIYRRPSVHGKANSSSNTSVSID